MAKTCKALSTNSQEVLDFIRSLGIDPYLTSRVIIDIDVENPIVRVYVEMLASDKTLEIITPVDLDVKVIGIK